MTEIAGDGEAAERLRGWRAAAPNREVDRIMDCNIGFDPRGDLAAADNMVVHCFEGGLMVGIGSPYEYRPEGSRKSDFHLDLLFTDADVLLDGEPLILHGRLVA